MLVGANQMKKKVLSIIGGGWLGSELAHGLLTLGNSLVVTTTHDKSAEFNLNDVSYFQLDLSQRPIVPNEIRNSEVLIYMIPPLEIDFITSFFDQIPADKKIIFISSTSVYGKTQGVVNEESLLNENFSNSPLLLQTESYLKKRFKNITILRPGGLYGQKRHPVYFLQGKTHLKTGQEFLHLAHQEDCVKAIINVLRFNQWNEVFNIVSDLRIKKCEYYTEMARKLNLSSPSYDLSDSIVNYTQISNEKSKKTLEMTYLNPWDFGQK
jgi:nucleoside-diphosphate-sugar epimerase